MTTFVVDGVCRRFGAALARHLSYKLMNKTDSLCLKANSAPAVFPRLFDEWAILFCPAAQEPEIFWF